MFSKVKGRLEPEARQKIFSITRFYFFNPSFFFQYYALQFMNKTDIIQCELLIFSSRLRIDLEYKSYDVLYIISGLMIVASLWMILLKFLITLDYKKSAFDLQMERGKQETKKTNNFLQLNTSYKVLVLCWHGKPFNHVANKA